MARPRLPRPEAIVQYLEVSHSANHYSNNGPVLVRYQKEIAAFLGVSEDAVVILSSATQCIQGLVSLLGSESWLVPDFTFAATGTAVISAGKKIRLADVDSESMRLTVSSTNGEILNEENGLLAVMPFGTRFAAEDWPARRNMVFDAAASLGNYENCLSGIEASSAVVFSLHATKVLGAGEGGIAVCGSSELARGLRQWSQFGFDENRRSIAPGTNAKMSEFNAAVGMASLDQRDEEIDEWIELRKVANEITQQFLQLNVSQKISGASPYWLLMLRDSNSAKRLASHMQELGIETRQWWPEPLTHMPLFRSANALGNNPNAIHLSGSLLGLPFYRGMGTREFARIHSALEKFDFEGL